MRKITEQTFEEIYHNTDTQAAYCTYDELVTMTGIQVHELRGAVEDLKELGYVVENENGIQITGPGIAEAGTRWVD